MRVAASLQLFFLRAQHHNELIGDTLEVDVSLSMPKGDAKDILANVDCRMAGDQSADQGKQGALEKYYATVQATWLRLCRIVLGCLAMDSAISEFRNTARMLIGGKSSRLRKGITERI